jgi:4-carboxymuconolactone decarboxylase
MSERSEQIRASLPPARRETQDRIGAGGRGGFAGPHDVWIHSKELEKKIRAVGGHLRFENVLERRLTELAILLVARKNTSQIEWIGHVPMAREAGISAAVIEAIAERKPPAFERADEAAVYDYAQAVLALEGVPDAVFERAVAQLGAQATVELTVTLGYYTMVSMTLKAYQLGPPPETARQLSE